MSPAAQYVRFVSGQRTLIRRLAFDLLVLLAALESAAEVAFRDDPVRAPRTTLWFTVPAIVVLFTPAARATALPVRGAGRPSGSWQRQSRSSTAGSSFSRVPCSWRGSPPRFSSGNLSDGVQARTGLVIAARRQPRWLPTTTRRAQLGEFIFLPVLCAIVWTGRARAAAPAPRQADAAESRAARAERERETLARIAVAEERTRIARELHDIVAHSMSVMVAAGRRRPAPASRRTRPRDQEALEDVERTGRTALTEMRRLLGAMRRETDDVDLAPQPGLAALEPLLGEMRRTGLRVELEVEGEPAAVPRSARPLGVPDHSGGPDERCSSTRMRLALT